MTDLAGAVTGRYLNSQLAPQVNRLAPSVPLLRDIQLPACVNCRS